MYLWDCRNVCAECWNLCRNLAVNGRECASKWCRDRNSVPLNLPFNVMYLLPSHLCLRNCLRKEIFLRYFHLYKCRNAFGSAWSRRNPEAMIHVPRGGKYPNPDMKWKSSYGCCRFCVFKWKYTLTLILLTWRIWWAPNNASRWQMGFNSAFRGLSR